MDLLIACNVRIIKRLEIKVILCSASPSDPEWGEWTFLDGSDVSGANMYINDILSLLNNDKTDAGSTTANLVESQACYLDTTTSSVSMTSALQLKECKPDINVSQQYPV